MYGNLLDSNTTGTVGSELGTTLAFGSANILQPTIEISFGTHHWSTWGNEKIVNFWKGQRDIYHYIHDETLRLANHGQTFREVGENVKLPDSLAKQFSNRNYYGTVNHNARLPCCTPQSPRCRKNLLAT